MNILCVISKYDYGVKSRGLSFLYYNIYEPLKKIYREVAIFDFRSIFDKEGKEIMNKKLLNYVKKNKPTIVFFCLQTDHFIPEVLNEIRKYSKTICYYNDDGWRWDFSKEWSKYFDFITSIDVIWGSKRYKQELGYNNAIDTMYGCSDEIYKNLNLEKKYDISFVGGYHPYRNWIIKSIKKAGYNVEAWGYGWKNGRVSQEEMVKIFNQSKINLNLENSVSYDIRYLLSSPRNIISTLLSPKNVPEMKARFFEISGCGGFQISYFIDGLQKYYKIGEELIVFTDINDLLRKIDYYLKHDKERELIADKGYERTIKDHTTSKRLKDIINIVLNN